MSLVTENIIRIIGDSLAEFKTGVISLPKFSSNGGNLEERVTPELVKDNKRRDFCLDKRFLLLKGGRVCYNHCS